MVKKLNQKEITKILQLINSMMEYKDKHLDCWEHYIDGYGMYFTRAELIVMQRIYAEVGIDIDIGQLPAIKSIGDSFDAYVENENSIEDTLIKFVYPSETVMKEKGWEETEIYLDETSFEYNDTDIKFSNMNEDEIQHELCRQKFGIEYADALPKLIIFMESVSDNTIYPNNSHLMKCERAGKFYEFAEQKPSIKRTKLYKQIIQCLNVIVEPYQCYYYVFDEMQVKNGCLYAFSTAGEISDSGEFICMLHSKLSRYLCIEILDLLLNTAEKHYGYNEKSGF